MLDILFVLGSVFLSPMYRVCFERTGFVLFVYCTGFVLNVQVCFVCVLGYSPPSLQVLCYLFSYYIFSFRMRQYKEAELGLVQMRCVRALPGARVRADILHVGRTWRSKRKKTLHAL
jgi:hypothetical protein